MGAVDLIVSLVKVGVVFGLLIITLRLLSRSRSLRGEGARSRRAPALEVLDKTRVGRTSSVVTVRVGDRALLLGVTESQITTLADVTDSLPSPDAGATDALFAGTGQADAATDRSPDDVDVRSSVLDHALELIRSGRIR